MYLQVAGCGDAFGSGGRNNACFVLRGESGTVLLDCGATSLPALKRLGIGVASIDAVLISHFHGDHYGGVPFLLLEGRYLEPRVRPLQVGGPPGIADRVSDLAVALYNSGSASPDPSIVEFHDLTPGTPRRVGPAEVHPVLVDHQEGEICLALRIVMDGKTIAYSGDTRWCPALADASRDADLFLWECTHVDGDAGAHTSLADVLEQRGRLGCRKLVLTHLGPEVLAVRGDHDLVWAEDGMRIDL